MAEVTQNPFLPRGGGKDVKKSFRIDEVSESSILGQQSERRRWNGTFSRSVLVRKDVQSREGGLSVTVDNFENLKHFCSTHIHGGIWIVGGAVNSVSKRSRRIGNIKNDQLTYMHASTQPDRVWYLMWFMTCLSLCRPLMFLHLLPLWNEDANTGSNAVVSSA